MPAGASPLPTHLPAVRPPSSAASLETWHQYSTGAGQQNTGMMPGKCQPRARIGVACGPILFRAQTEAAGTRVRRAQTQRGNRHVSL